MSFEFKSSYNVYEHHYTQSQNIAHCATFPFLPFPKFTPPAHAPFNKLLCYALIGNYPSFKMIPNTTYIVPILKKYNRPKSSFLTLCAGNIFRWRWCVYYLKKSVMPILDNQWIQFSYRIILTHIIHHIFRQRAIFCHKIQMTGVLGALCAPLKLRYAGDKIFKILGRILCKWTILDNQWIQFSYRIILTHIIHHIFRQRAIFCHKIPMTGVLQAPFRPIWT